MMILVLLNLLVVVGLGNAQLQKSVVSSGNHNSSSPPIPTQIFYMRRMRKAGSTTIEYFIRDALRIRMNWLSGIDPERDSKQEARAKIKRAKADQYPIMINRIEYASLNSACAIKSSASSPAIVLVTHFREPLARLYSEFWYRGPGFWTGESNKALWKAWLAEGGAAWNPCTLYSSTSRTSMWNDEAHRKSCAMHELQRRSKLHGEGVYFANYQLRLLASACDGGQCSGRLSSEPDCSCPADRGRRLGAADLAQAKEVLSRFSWILIVEEFSSPTLNLYLQLQLEERLNVPRGLFKGHKLGWKRYTEKKMTELKFYSSRRAARRGKLPKAATSPSTKRRRRLLLEGEAAVAAAAREARGPADLHPDILARLKRENALDMDLYKYAASLSAKRVAAFMSEQQGERPRDPLASQGEEAGAVLITGASTY